MYMETWNAHRVVRPSRLANAVIERLLLRILDGEFQPNGDLPPEAALAQEFAVSRTILREALKALEEKRVLRIRHGRGTTVRPKADWNILDPLVLSVLLEYGGSPTLASELHEVRAAVQVLMADLAARRGTPEQREKLDAAMVRMRHCAVSGADEHGYRDAAHGFACVLAEAAGNEVARCVVETIDLPFAYDGGSVGGGVPEDRAGGRGSMAKTQEFAEFLYARVLRGASAAGTPNESDASDKSDESADPPAVGVALPGQAVTRAAQEHRVGDLRAVMVGAGH